MDTQVTHSEERREAEHQEIRAALHALNNALSPVVGYAELLAIHPDTARDTVLSGYSQGLRESAIHAAEATQHVQRLVAAHGARTAAASQTS